MQAGEMRHRVTIAERLDVKTPRGGFTEADQQIWRRIPALVEPLTGRELQAQMQIDPRLRYRVTLRYVSGLKATQVVTYHGFDGDRALEIVQPPIVDEKARMMTLMCGEAQA